MMLHIYNILRLAVVRTGDDHELFGEFRLGLSLQSVAPVAQLTDGLLYD